MVLHDGELVAGPGLRGEFRRDQDTGLVDQQRSDLVDREAVRFGDRAASARLGAAACRLASRASARHPACRDLDPLPALALSAASSDRARAGLAASAAVAVLTALVARGALRISASARLGLHVPRALALHRALRGEDRELAGRARAALLERDVALAGVFLDERRRAVLRGEVDHDGVHGPAAQEAHGLHVDGGFGRAVQRVDLSARERRRRGEGDRFDEFHPSSRQRRAMLSATLARLVRLLDRVRLRRDDGLEPQRADLLHAPQLLADQLRELRDVRVDRHDRDRPAVVALDPDERQVPDRHAVVAPEIDVRSSALMILVEVVVGAQERRSHPLRAVELHDAETSGEDRHVLRVERQSGHERAQRVDRVAAAVRHDLEDHGLRERLELAVRNVVDRAVLDEPDRLLDLGRSPEAHVVGDVALVHEVVEHVARFMREALLELVFLAVQLERGEGDEVRAVLALLVDDDR